MALRSLSWSSKSTGRTPYSFTSTDKTFGDTKAWGHRERGGVRGGRGETRGWEKEVGEGRV
jgi:hypothetical protein